MATTPEGKIKKLVTTMLKKYEPHVWYFMPIGGPYAAKGTPDFILCVNGRFASVETKAKGKKPTTLQSMCHDKIRQANGKVWVIDDGEGIASLETFINETLK